MAFAQVTFVSDKHPRGVHGRFAGRDHGNMPSFSAKPLQADPLPRRSATRGERWQRTGPLHAPAANEIPIDYTGSRAKEHETGTMLEHKFTPQIPKKMDVKDYMATLGKLAAVASTHKKAIIDKAMTEGVKVPTHKFSGPKHTTWMPPDGTAHRSMVRAYVHGTKLALHDTGTVDYHFKMDDHLKDEMRPLVPFIRHVRKRLNNEMNVAVPGHWHAFRAEFGHKFPTPKIDKRPGSATFGQERKRVRPNQELVKMIAATPLARPGVLPVASVGPNVSRFARYRQYLARNESMGIRNQKPLTQAQKLQRLHAGIDERRKIQSGAPRLQPGMPGSLAGDHIQVKRNPALPPVAAPAAPAVPGVKK